MKRLRFVSTGILLLLLGFTAPIRANLQQGGARQQQAQDKQQQAKDKQKEAKDKQKEAKDKQQQAKDKQKEAKDKQQKAQQQKRDQTRQQQQRVQQQKQDQTRQQQQRVQQQRQDQTRQQQQRVQQQRQDQTRQQQQRVQQQRQDQTRQQQQRVQQQRQDQTRQRQQRAEQQRQDQARQRQQRAEQQRAQQRTQALNRQQRQRAQQQQSAWQQRRARNWQAEHRTWQQRGGYTADRIPQDRYRNNFGPNHPFRIYHNPVVVTGGYPGFLYNGFYFSIVDPWPQYWSNNWYENDDVYVDYSGDGYYLYNRRYPQDRISLSVYINFVPQNDRRSVWLRYRANNWRSQHRDWRQRGGYNGYRIPDDRYRRYFGRNHRFRINNLPLVVSGGYPRFQYGGFWFSVVDPWPQYWSVNWYNNDDMYIDYSGDGYYMYNRRYPRDRIAISVTLH